MPATLLACAMIVACALATKLPDLEKLASEEAAGALDGSVKLKFRRGADGLQSTADHVATAMGCGSARRIFREAGRFDIKHAAAGLDSWYTPPCDGDARRRLGDKDARGSTGVHAAISRLVPEHSARRRDSVASSISELLENVTYVSAGYAVKRSSYVPSDPYFSTQTHYTAIDLEVAWDLSAGNPDIAVQ